MESIFEQLDEAAEVDVGTVERDKVSGHLEVRGLGFVYPGTDKQVLHDISFTVEPGRWWRWSVVRVAASLHWRT